MQVLAGELVRRVSGQMVGAFLREYIATPHRLDMHIGIPEHMDARVADLVAGQVRTSPQVVHRNLTNRNATSNSALYCRG